MRSKTIGVAWAVLAVLASVGLAGEAAPGASRADELFARRKLVAWCIVPFDGKKRMPSQRVEMLERIGIRHYAYDWRDEHLPTFNTELDELAKHHIELTAVWFPGALTPQARVLLDGIKAHHLKTQLWVMEGIDPGADTEKGIAQGVEAIRPIAKEAAGMGCTVALYNHGGWWGEPEHQIAIVERLRGEGFTNVGMVYNLHHGHEHLPRFAELLGKMKPYLMALNLNGMVKNGEKVGRMILPIGRGDYDLELLRTIVASGYDGPIGILNHTDEDAEGRLLDNIEGLEWLVAKLDGRDAGSVPPARTYHPPTAAGPATRVATDYWSVEDAAARKKLPTYKVIPAAAVAELTPAVEPEPQAEGYGEWYRSHGSAAGTRYSALDQINRANVKSLKTAWTYHSGDGAGNLQSNPVVVDGVMYVPTVGEYVVAVDAATGRERWRFKAEGRPAFRGLLYHRGEGGAGDRLLFVAGTNLWALDPKTGRPVETFGEGGRVHVESSVVAPAVYQDVIVLPGYQKDVWGYDVNTGVWRWTFHTIPQAGEPYAETWDKPDEGANCWAGMALDARRGIAYISTGSPKPNFHGPRHLGDNLFANCVIALDAVTGTRLWHFQEIRHDIWDLDIPAPPVLVQVTREGKKFDAVAVVTKIGNTLLLDRVTGKPLFPFRLRRAPVSTVPGERTAPYQPDVEMPEPLTKWFESKDLVTELSPASHKFIMDKIEHATFGWFVPMSEHTPYVIKGFNGGAEWTGAAFDPGTGLLYVNTNEVPWLPMIFRHEKPEVDETKVPKTAGRVVYERNCMVCHGPSREGLAVNPSLLGVGERKSEAEVVTQIEKGKGSMPAFPKLQGQERAGLLAYLFEKDRPAGSKPAVRPERPTYRDIGYPRLLDQDGYPGVKPPWGLMNAIDLNSGKIVWRVPLGEYPELTKRGVPVTGSENFGGAIVTAGGLVFVSGTHDPKIRAFDKATGEELWSAELPFTGSAPPTTYQVNGKQYVVITACGGGKLETPKGDAYVAFALP